MNTPTAHIGSLARLKGLLRAGAVFACAANPLEARRTVVEANRRGVRYELAPGGSRFWMDWPAEDAVRFDGDAFTMQLGDTGAWLEYRVHG